MIRVEGKTDEVKYKTIFKEYLLEFAKDLRLGRFTLQQDNVSKQIAKATMECFRPKHINVLEWDK